MPQHRSASGHITTNIGIDLRLSVPRALGHIWAHLWVTGVPRSPRLYKDAGRAQPWSERMTRRARPKRSAPPRGPVRRATAGHCARCGLRLIRGIDDTGQVARADARYLDAAHELAAWAAGLQTYRLSWRDAMQLDRRTIADLLVDPAGFSAHRCLVDHRCGEPLTATLHWPADTPTDESEQR